MNKSKSKNLHDIADALAGPSKSSNAAGISNYVQAVGEPARAAMTALVRAREAGGGAVRQKHIAEAQSHIAQIDPTQHPELLRHLQAHIVAISGRGADTEIAHLTPGEIVIPKRLQTPEFLKALYMAAHAFGIDPARLIVGSGENVINPRTGQPEFDDEGGGDNDGDIDEITVTAPRIPWSPEDYYYGERLPFTEAADQNNPELAQAIISTAINRVGLPGYPGKPDTTLSDTIQEPGQFRGINNSRNQPWIAAQAPNNMNPTDAAIFSQYRDIVHKRMSGELPDNSGGATFFYRGEPTAKDLKGMAPLVQTTKIGGFTFYKPAPKNGR
jgi:hypothetical protein